MAARITVVATPRSDGWECRINVAEQGSETHHTVTLTRAYLEKLAPQSSPEHFVEKSFEFLLAREPKEAILRSFDLAVISRYFPEYEQQVRKIF